ncbi:PVC-type heme-binding CxxCH protein [Flavitalea antarctica]
MKEFSAPLPFAFTILAVVSLMVSCSDAPSVSHTKAALFVAPDLEATLWAESPMFFNPTNMDVDLRGRIWITEAVNYRDFRNDSTKHLYHSAGDRVMILEDLDQDGVADTSKIFVQDVELRSPLGIAVSGNKVIVSCSPSVIIYTDTNGDDKPDQKQVFLTGFGGRDHDHGLHSGMLGPDGKLYFNTGNAGPHEVTDKSGWKLNSGSVYNYSSPYATKNQGGMKSDDGKIWTGGLVFRINPDGTGLEVVAHNFRNSYEVIMDSFGDFWQNDNDDEKAACRTSFILEGGNAGFFSATGERTWQADRRPGQTINQAHWHQEDPGVMPVGDIYGSGSPTGIALIEGDELGTSYRGTLLSADAGRNIIFGYKPTREGAGFGFKDRINFIASVDKDDKNYTWHKVGEDTTRWFRPSDVTIGTDGAIYVADWFDPIVGGHQMNDPKGFGKIYRIAPKNKKLVAPKFDTSSVEGLTRLLFNPAMNVRNIAFEKLKLYGDKALPELTKHLTIENPYHKARLIWLIAAIGEKGLDIAESFLQDKDPQIRICAFRSITLHKKDELRGYASKMMADPDPAVRRAVALALRKTSIAGSGDILLTLIQGYDGQDRWYLNALGIAVDGRGDSLYPAILKQFNDPDPASWSPKLLNLVTEFHPIASAKSLRNLIISPGINESMKLQAITALAFIPTAEAAAIMREVEVSKIRLLNSQAKYWLQFRKSNDWRPYLADWTPPADLMPDPQPELLALRLKTADTTIGMAVRLRAAMELTKSRAGKLHLVHLAATKKLPDTIRQNLAADVMNDEDKFLKSLAAHFFLPPDTAAYDFKTITSLKADVNKGKNLVLNNCLVCHKVGSMGGETGPVLTSIQDKFDQVGLLGALVRPDEGIAFGSETYLITTKSGGIIYGILLSNGAVITAVDAYGRQYMIDEKEILTKQSLKNSLMPSPVYLELSKQDLSDISAFLLSNKKD